jgi:Tfp pilus assembly protein PilX
MRTNSNKIAPASRLAALRGRAMRQRGVVLVAVIVVFSVSLTLFGLWSRSVIRERRSLATQQFRIQAVRLAEAGLQRAISLRAADAKYAEEVWSVPASELDNKHAAQVRLRVAPTTNADKLRYESTAEFPSGALHRVQITKSVEIQTLVR